jgi:hypothetical protein
MLDNWSRAAAAVDISPAAAVLGSDTVSVILKSCTPPG